ncbi:hypothetical protein ABZU76_45525 [Amycolatopsis sp. NPDC005232]|uniref:hypothetical protein n=1 Tax=Amycolatopsis sp. NPDC005232 TaxID=3157027 RepID=UPI0033B14C7E
MSRRAGGFVLSYGRAVRRGSPGATRAALLHDAAARRDARKAAEPVRIQLDPLELI